MPFNDKDCKKPDPIPKFCPQLPGTILRIAIPPGATINLLNFLELTSPGGICLILRIPILSGVFNVQSLVQMFQDMGGTIEFEKID